MHPAIVLSLGPISRFRKWAGCPRMCIGSLPLGGPGGLTSVTNAKSSNDVQLVDDSPAVLFTRSKDQTFA